MQELSGGREKAIFKHQNTVVRPLNHWSKSVHQLLKHLHQHGFKQCPKFISADECQETLSFMEGDTYNYPLNGAIASKTALLSVAKLLREFHRVSKSFVERFNVSDMPWMLPAQQPIELICHGDFTPYNVALQGEQVVAVFDFDTAHPAPALWDLAFTVYCWAPFKVEQSGALEHICEQIDRARLFCDAYNASKEQRFNLVPTIIRRLQALIDYMRSEAQSGNAQFQQDIAQGHLNSYFADIEYLQRYETDIREALLANV